MQHPLVPNQEKTNNFDFFTGEDCLGLRLDQYLAHRFPDYTRTFLKNLIKNGQIEVDGKKVKASTKLREGSQILVTLPELEEFHIKPEKMPLDIVYEDTSLVILNKASGLVVHPAKGHNTGTLVNALVAHFEELSSINNYRPGIVHRLDRFTTGLLVIAKNNQAHAVLAKQFEKRETQKEYLALVEGNLSVEEGIVALPLAMDRRNRQKMSVSHGGKPAETSYRVLAKYPNMDLVHVFPKTGRTHQIRVHLKHQECPIIADSLYGAKELLVKEDIWQRMSSKEKEEHKSTFDSYFEGIDLLMDRQALHAWKISFQHPENGKTVTFTAPLAKDFWRTLQVLQKIWPSKKIDFSDSYQEKELR